MCGVLGFYSVILRKILQIHIETTKWMGAKYQAAFTTSSPHGDQRYRIPTFPFNHHFYHIFGNQLLILSSISFSSITLSPSVLFIAKLSL
jgi:hypothetical protein